MASSSPSTTDNRSNQNTETTSSGDDDDDENDDLIKQMKIAQSWKQGFQTKKRLNKINDEVNNSDCSSNDDWGSVCGSDYDEYNEDFIRILNENDYDDDDDPFDLYREDYLLSKYHEK